MTDRIEASDPDHQPDRPEPAESVVLDRVDQLEAIAGPMRAASRLAIDTESNSMFVYRERVCLLQLAYDETALAIDPLPLPQGPHALAAVASALEDPEQPVLLHGGEYDVAVLKREFDIGLRGVFDTQQAASYLGWERTGYGALVERVFGVTLPKGHAQHDWGRRPLDAAALRYAIDDVRYLSGLVDHLQAEIDSADIAEEVRLANLAVEDADPHAVEFDPAGFHKVKGAGGLDASETLCLQVLWRWRDERAAIANRPAGRLLNQHKLVALARRPPRTRNDLRAAKLPSPVVRAHGESLLEALNDAAKSPPEPIRVVRRPARSAATRRKIEALKKWRRAESEARGVALPVVLPARALNQLAESPAAELESVALLGRKRIERYGEAIRACLV